ncbi:ferredoxin [Nocardia sp. BMG111209]|uniref:ferredoxin n=1 Tax=Nocardia sp. BMG111209 TaxID=1160137 RepID=UPI000377012D|nr:ferredoxin [Nocardia sp. BMG111209]
MKVRVELDRCIGAGHCVLLAPDVFDQRVDDGVVVLLNDTPAPESHAAVRESAVACPASVIGLTDS